MPFVAATVAQATGAPIDRIAPMTARAPVRAIRLVALADLDTELSGEGRTMSEKG